jgi:hypothetical protein
MPSQPVKVALQLRIELEDVSPTVWRRLLVPTSVRMAKLSEMILCGMGWAGGHLHCFTVGKARFGMVLDDYPEDEIDESSVTVRQALRTVTKFGFEYDFGDGWDHIVKIEAELASPFGLKAAVCLGGENACPPDDCGGPYGYAEMLAVLGDAEHKEHASLVEWIGGPFDPTEFDLVGTNALLQKL